MHDDYDLERPSVELKTQKALPRSYAPSDYEVFDYPGHYLQKADGEQYADVRIDEFGSQFETAHGVDATREGLSVGSLFTLDGLPARRSEPRVPGRWRRATTWSSATTRRCRTAAARAIAAASSRCRASSSSGRSAATPKPFVQGPQTAVVVGPAGDEIYTDKYGRVKVQFHWDRDGKKDENSSCWIRVSQPWAGKSWGAVAMPRIGQEVIVDFLEGDPDQPIITGRVYNAEQMPPYELPANKTQTRHQERAARMGGGPANFNEIRFEDKKGSEQVFIHAEKNQDIEVENDETHWVGHDRTKTIDHDETTHVKHDRTETVDNNETITVHGNRTETVDKDETITIGGNRTETVDKNETITIDEEPHRERRRQRERSVSARDQSVSIGSEQDADASTRTNRSPLATAALTQVGEERRRSRSARTGRRQVGENDSLKVGKKLLIDAGDQITIKTGSASITMKKDGTITIKGKDITIDGSGKINVKASSDVVIKGSKVTQN